jgi:hypothetical protein
MELVGSGIVRQAGSLSYSQLTAYDRLAACRTSPHFLLQQSQQRFFCRVQAHAFVSD